VLSPARSRFVVSLVLALSVGFVTGCAPTARLYGGDDPEETAPLLADITAGSSTGSARVAPAVAVSTSNAAVKPVTPGASVSTGYPTSVMSSAEPASAPGVCGDAELDVGEECDDGSGNSDTLSNTCRTTCVRASCGDAVRDAAEECDDGNSVDTDGCSTLCKLPKCGDSIQQVGETCDDGNSVNDDACSNLCKLPGCGDSIVQTGEECDDGNSVNNDGCSNLCKLPGCRDGILQAGEACDDGNTVTDDACSNNCTVPGCGDSIVQMPGEECDDGNLVSSDSCTVACKLPKCGDNFLQPGEECDDGNTLSNDMCTATCKFPVCGDGILSTGETCEDGNKTDGDGCSALCQSEVCGDGKTSGAEQCDDGNKLDNDGCSATCRNETCGDGIVQSPREDCEDLNTVDTDICRNGCKKAATLKSLSNSCGNLDQITQTVCMVAVANWCKQYSNTPIAGMVTGKKADNEYTVGCVTGFQRQDVANSLLSDQCGGGHQQSPSCLDKVSFACRGLGFTQGFYIGNGSSSDTTAVACGSGAVQNPESISACNGIGATNPVPVECAQALAAKCGNGKGGMLQALAQSNQVTYTCIDLSLTGSARQL
jgi:cysteine-rich repeat protein